MMDTYQRSTSKAILFVVAIFSLLLGRLFWLQVLTSSSSVQSALRPASEESGSYLPADA